MDRQSALDISPPTAIEAEMRRRAIDRHGSRWMRGPAAFWLGAAAALLAARFGLAAFVPDPTAGSWRDGITWITEIVVVTGLMVWVVRSAAGPERLRGVQGHVVRALLAVATVVHLVPLIPHTYPFAHWSMYTVPASEIVYSEVRLVSQAGDDVGPLPITDLVPGRPARAFGDLIDDWLVRVDAGEPGAGTVLAEAIHGFLLRIDDPGVARLEVRRCSVSDPTPQRPAACETVMVVGR